MAWHISDAHDCESLPVFLSHLHDIVVMQMACAVAHSEHHIHTQQRHRQTLCHSILNNDLLHALALMPGVYGSRLVLPGWLVLTVIFSDPPFY